MTQSPPPLPPQPLPGPRARPAPVPAPATGVVEAAGAVCWRVSHGQLQLLLVHRPRYDDWSWPKGKLEAGETHPEAAVREVAEETGISIRLGVPLPAARYRLAESLDKHVAYWAAAVSTDTPPAPPLPLEVDALEWLSPEDASQRLTRRADRVQVSAVVQAHQDATLDTWPLIVLRHAVAHPRTVWGQDDAERPLVAAGARQADALVPLLHVWGPVRVLSSPARRCVDTVRPYADRYGTKLRAKGSLTEEGHRRDPAKVARLVTKLVSRERPVVVCTHRPALGTLLGAVAGRTGVGLAAAVPAQDPFLEPGELLVAHLSRRSGRVVAVERHLPARG